MGPGQAIRESVHTLGTKHRWIGPYRYRIDNLSRRRRYTPAVLLVDPGNKKRSSAHYTRHLPLCATSNLSGSHHGGLYWRASVRLKSVWSFDTVGSDPIDLQQDQDRGENVDR